MYPNGVYPQVPNQAGLSRRAFQPERGYSQEDTTNISVKLSNVEFNDPRSATRRSAGGIGQPSFRSDPNVARSPQPYMPGGTNPMVTPNPNFQDNQAGYQPQGQDNSQAMGGFYGQPGFMRNAPPCIPQISQQNPLYNCLLQALNNLVAARCKPKCPDKCACCKCCLKPPQPCCPPPCCVRKPRNPCCPKRKCCCQPQPPNACGSAIPNPCSCGQYVTRIRTMSRCVRQKPRGCCPSAPTCCPTCCPPNPRGCCCPPAPTCCPPNPLSPSNLCPAPQAIASTNPFENQCSTTAPILLVQGGRCQTIQIADVGGIDAKRGRRRSSSSSNNNSKKKKGRKSKSKNKRDDDEDDDDEDDSDDEE